MSLNFQATQFSVMRELGVMSTTLSADSTEDDDWYLLLQYKASYDAQDVKFGMDKPYIEICGQGCSWYGNIVEFQLSRDRVTVQMSADAAQHMGNDGAIEVTFVLGEEDFAQLRSALGETFKDAGYFRDLV
jgi:hypothetical protein